MLVLLTTNVADFAFTLLLVVDAVVVVFRLVVRTYIRSNGGLGYVGGRTRLLSV